MAIEATGLRGDVIHADSVNGAVRLSFAEAPSEVRADSSDGEVELVVPDDDATYRVYVDNIVGSIDTAVRTDPRSTRTIEATTDNGSITVRYPTG